MILASASQKDALAWAAPAAWAKVFFCAAAPGNCSRKVPLGEALSEAVR
jgi:hypothetical protein